MTGRSLAVAMSAIMPVPLAWVVVPAALMGQELVRIPSTPTCPKCRIELEHVVTLGRIAGGQCRCQHGPSAQRGGRLDSRSAALRFPWRLSGQWHYALA